MVTLGGLVVLARIFKPEHFGSLATIVSLGVVLTTIASGRFDLGIVVDAVDERAARLVELVMWLGLVGSACIAIGCLAVALFGMTAGMTSSLAVGMWFLPAVVLASVLNLAGVGCATRQQRYRLIAASQFANAAGTLIAQLSMAVLLPMSIALPVGYVCGQVCALALLLPHAWAFVASSRQGRSLAGLWDAAVQARTFPLHVTPYSFVGQLYAQVPQLLVTFFFGVSVGGQYSNAVRISFAPMTLLPSAIGQVLFGEMARSPQDRNWGRRIAQTTAATGVLLSIFVAALASAGPQLMTAILGPEWDISGHISRIIVVGSLAVALVAGNDRIFDVFGLQRLRLLLILANTIVLATLLALLGAAQAPLTAFMAGLVVVQVVASLNWGFWALRSGGFAIAPWLRALAYAALAVLFWLLVFELIDLRAVVPAVAKFVSTAAH